MERRFESGIPFQCGSVVQWERTLGYEPRNWGSNPHGAAMIFASCSSAIPKIFVRSFGFAQDFGWRLRRRQNASSSNPHGAAITA